MKTLMDMLTNGYARLASRATAKLRQDIAQDVRDSIAEAQQVARTSRLPLEQIVAAPEWSGDHARRLKDFLDSETGRVLLHRARAAHVDLMQRVCSTEKSRRLYGTVPLEAAYPAGWGDFHDWLVGAANEEMISRGASALSEAQSEEPAGTPEDLVTEVPTNRLSNG